MQGFLRDDGAQIGGQVVHVHGHLEDVGVEPGGIHREEALVAVVLAPGVLHAEAAALPGLVNVDAGEEHRVIHRGLAGVDALFLGGGEVHAEQVVEVVEALNEQAGGAIRLLAAVGTEPDGAARGEDGSRDLTDLLDGGVHVQDRATADDIAHVVDGQGVALGVLGTRVVDEAHVLREVHVHVAGVELARGKDAIAVELARIVTPLPLEGGRGSPRQMRGCADTVGQRSFLDLVDLFLGGSVCDEGTKLQGGAAQDDLRRLFIGAVWPEDSVSGIAVLGTRPCLRYRDTAMSHWPPSERTSPRRNCRSRPSRSSVAAVAMMSVRKKLARSNLSQKRT